MNRDGNFINSRSTTPPKERPLENKIHVSLIRGHRQNDTEQYDVGQDTAASFNMMGRLMKVVVEID